MPGQDEAERRSTAFNRRTSDVDRGARIAETDDEKAIADKAKPALRFEIPMRTGGRATIVERDNPEEYLEFHWDPSSYKISKAAKWTETAVEGGTPTVQYSGSSLMIVKFTLLLNEIGNHHPTQRSVEDSIEWLVNRTRARNEFQVARRGPDRRRGRPWLKELQADARLPPPILVLFGLRDGFECVLDDLDLSTIFQNGPFPLEAAAFSDRHDGRSDRPRPLSGAPDRLQREPTTRDAIVEGAQRANSRGITRATLDVTLKEYVNTPE